MARVRTTENFSISVDPDANFSGNWSSLATSTATAPASTYDVIGAINTLPDTINHTVTLNLSGDTYSEIDLYGFSGSGTIKIIGTWSLVTPATGLSSGTCQAGSTATSVVVEGANLTADDLQEKWIGVTVNGVETVTPIKDHTTTAITIDSIANLDTTSTYRILEPSTVITTLTAAGLGVKLHVEAVDLASANIDGVLGQCKFKSCQLDQSVSGGTLDIDTCMYPYLDRVLVKDSASVDITGGAYTTIADTFVSDGTITVDGGRADVDAEAHDCASSGLTIKNTSAATITYVAKDCTATPLVLDNAGGCYGAGSISGTSNTGDYGIKITGRTTLDITGSTTLSGSTDDMQVEGYDASYTTISNNGGNYLANGSSVTTSSSTGLTIPNYVTILQDLIVSGSPLIYGILGLDGDAVTASGSTINDAAALGPNFNYVTGTPGAVKFTYAPTAAGTKISIYVIINDCGATLPVFPQSASGTINGGSAGASYDIPANSIAIAFTTSGTNFQIASMSEIAAS